MEKIAKATHEGELKIGQITIPCAVLEDGTRVLTQGGILRALGRSRTARMPKSEQGGGVILPAFLRATNLKPFISKDLELASMPINFKPKKGSRAYGYKADLLPLVCQVYLEARDADQLHSTQVDVAITADILIRGLAHIGIIALVDEATGYQEIRDRLALQKILDRYLLKEYAVWAKRFPDEFYELIFRLKRWQWNGVKPNRPSVVGKYTNDIVYERLAPNILEQLRRRNPPDEKHQRRSKHHQWLTEDIGHPALQRHLYMVIALMRSASNWETFYRSLQRALPKLNEQIPLALEE